MTIRFVVIAILLTLLMLTGCASVVKVLENPSSSQNVVESEKSNSATSFTEVFNNPVIIEDRNTINHILDNYRGDDFTEHMKGKPIRKNPITNESRPATRDEIVNSGYIVDEDFMGYEVIFFLNEEGKIKSYEIRGRSSPTVRENPNMW